MTTHDKACNIYDSDKVMATHYSKEIKLVYLYVKETI